MHIQLSVFRQYSGNLYEISKTPAFFAAPQIQLGNYN